METQETIPDCEDFSQNSATQDSSRLVDTQPDTEIPETIISEPGVHCVYMFNPTPPEFVRLAPGPLADENDALYGIKIVCAQCRLPQIVSYDREQEASNTQENVIALQPPSRNINTNVSQESGAMLEPTPSRLNPLAPEFVSERSSENQENNDQETTEFPNHSSSNRSQSNRRQKSNKKWRQNQHFGAQGGHPHHFQQMRNVDVDRLRENNGTQQQIAHHAVQAMSLQLNRAMPPMQLQQVPVVYTSASQAQVIQYMMPYAGFPRHFQN